MKQSCTIKIIKTKIVKKIKRKPNSQNNNNIQEQKI